jgi:hypothetical protein
MSLTKAALCEKAQATFAWVEDVPIFGTIGVRSCPQLESSMRWVTYTDQDTGKVIPEERAKGPIHEIIDQVMIDETTPMFTDEDFDLIAAFDAEKCSHLLTAIRTFDTEVQKKESD